MPLHWKKDGPDLWETEEQFDGVPDFVVERFPGRLYRMKMRSARRSYWFETLRDAKDFAESVEARS